MGEHRDARGKLLPSTQRVTCLESWFQATCLDELPELLNVPRGDMRVVFPRPLLTAYLDRYTPEHPSPRSLPVAASARKAV